MRQYRKILLPVQFEATAGSVALKSEVREAISWAVALAQVVGANITFVHVIEQGEPGDLMPHLRAALDETVQDAAERDVTSHWEFMFGQPAAEIVSRAGQGDYDLVVMGTPHDLGVGGTPTRSVPVQVMLECAANVLIARRPAASSSRRVLVATNLTDACEEVLRRGIAFARWRKTPVHVIHACPGRASARDEDAMELLRSRLEVHVASALGGMGPPEGYSAAVEVGDPSDVIWDVVRRDRCDLVVMGMTGRVGAARILEGCNTAEVVIEDLPCSLLTVRPR